MNKNDDFDIDAYIDECDKDDKAFEESLSSFIKTSKIKKEVLLEFDEDLKKLKNLQTQIEEERKQEDAYVNTLTDEERKQYLKEKYERATKDAEKIFKNVETLKDQKKE